MNIANIDKVIDKLKSITDAEFNIAHLYTGARGLEIRRYRCGSAACVAGWANVVAGGPGSNGFYAALFLGLDYDTAADLFIPLGYRDTPNNFTRLRAIAVLKHLRDTGKVEWDRYTASGRVRRRRPAIVA